MSSIRNKLVKTLIRLGSLKTQRQTYQELRVSFEQDTGRMNKLPTGTLVESIKIGDRPAEWIAIDTFDRKPIILYFHGGAFVFGSINSHRGLASQIALHAQAKVLNLEYRLAPEHPYPAALDDAFFAYSWLLQNGHDPKNIILAGDSSGGGIVLSLLMRLRDSSLPLPRAAAVISPWTDLTNSGETIETNKKADAMVRKNKLDEWGAMYFGTANPKDPYVSPLFGSFKGLPPLLICVSADELLLSDATRAAEKAKAEGCSVQMLVGEDMLHVWPLFSSLIPEAKRSILEIADYIRKTAA